MGFLAFLFMKLARIIVAPVLHSWHHESPEAAAESVVRVIYFPTAIIWGTIHWSGIVPVSVWWEYGLMACLVMGVAVLLYLPLIMVLWIVWEIICFVGKLVGLAVLVALECYEWIDDTYHEYQSRKDRPVEPVRSEPPESRHPYGFDDLKG